MDQEGPRQELERQITQLKHKLKNQEALLKRETEWEGDELYKQLKQLEAIRIQKQQQYKQLMRDHYRFINSSWLQKTGEQFLQQKINKGIVLLNHEIDNILYSRNSKSSLSSSSMFQKVEDIEWLLSQKEQKHEKQQQKILEEINELEKILQNIK